MSEERHASILREVANRCGLSPVKPIARQPGVRGVYRVTVYYGDARARNSVGTLVRGALGNPTMEVVYHGRFDHRPLVYTLDADRYEAFALALQKTGFDRLPDQPHIPFYGVDLWLVERAAGEFLKSLVLAPSIVRQPYTTIVNLIDHYLPEALREIT